LLRNEEDFELFGSTTHPQKYMSVLTKDRNGNTYRRPIISPEKARKKKEKKNKKKHEWNISTIIIKIKYNFTE
jgi:hypothetical protein